MKDLHQHKLLSIIALIALAVGVFAAVGITSAQDPTLPPPPSPVESANYPVNTITVSGVGRASGAPDVAYIELGVEIVNPDLAEAFSEAASTMDAVTQALVELGLAQEDIQTSTVNVYPEDRFNPQTGEQGERVYRVRNTLRVTVRDVEQIEEVISTAVDAGANTIYNFNLGIADQASLEQTARAEAIENARARAEQLASALGISVGEPVVVVESYGIPGSPVQPLGGGGRDFAEASLPISEGQLAVSVEVTVTFRIAR